MYRVRSLHGDYEPGEIGNGYVYAEPKHAHAVVHFDESGYTGISTYLYAASFDQQQRSAKHYCQSGCDLFDLERSGPYGFRRGIL